MSALPRNARLLGLLVFLVGILLLIVVFVEARALLARPLPASLPDSGLRLAQHLGLLFIMGYAASSLAGRGCQMFVAAGTRPEA